MPFSQIAELLREKYQTTVNRQAIFKFIKVRAKGYKPCQYAWDIETTSAESQPTTNAPSLQEQTVFQPQKPTVSVVASKPMDPPSSFDPSKVIVTEYSATWNLHRPNTAEEREAYRQYIREEKHRAGSV